MHEKKAREKERRLLEQEKQIYQARVRSDIRAKLTCAENPVPGPEKPGHIQPNFGPLTPQEHIKALADRFMKEGAEDLWNENDGPSGFPENKPGKSQFIGEPIDLKKLIGERSNSSGGERIENSEFFRNVGGNVAKPRHFSTYTGQGGNLMGVSGNECLRTMSRGYNLVGTLRGGVLMGVSNMLNLNCYYSVDAASKMGKRPNFARNGRSSVVDDSSGTKVRSGGGRTTNWPRFRGGKMDSSDDDDDSDDYDEAEALENSRKTFNSSAALGKYDTKTKKRIPLKFLVEEEDLSQQVQAIRKEISQRKSINEDERENDKDESILSAKRWVGFNL